MRRVPPKVGLPVRRMQLARAFRNSVSWLALIHAFSSASVGRLARRRLSGLRGVGAAGFVLVLGKGPPFDAPGSISTREGEGSGIEPIR